MQRLWWFTRCGAVLAVVGALEAALMMPFYDIKFSHAWVLALTFTGLGEWVGKHTK